MDEAESGVAQRVAEWRKLVGLTQNQLASKANVSASLVRKVEQGRAPASPAFVAAVARALNTGVADLLGQPFAQRTRMEHRLHATIPPLRRELAAYNVAPDEGVQPRSLDDLAKAVALASHHRHAVNLDALGSELPGLLAELRAQVWSTTGAEQERAYWLLTEAYYAASQAAYKLGYIDLASLAVDRYEWAAERSGDELAVLVGDYQRAGEMIGAADWNGALRLLEQSRARIADQISSNDAPTLAVWGSLHLKSGLASARAGNLATADAHWNEANEAAQRLGADRDDYRLCFGPTNVNIWSVGLAVEAMDGTEAVKRAQRFDIPPQTQRERAGHHWIDVARGFLLHGDLDKATRSLYRAKEISPQQTKYHPMVHETIRTLARARRRTDPVARLAAWAGVQNS
ncbi:helix-turn-helix transcriptional regulator [Amycolatopsis rhizosphaerae]|uniref:Helix-turn-helix transcriptional regulator n=1 Tax=Amycolatopsis rhizosphaerae TaxID=2053003 RepID=A0A558C4X0_9PSEU|nr:helix-turn-helix transcriptional regulator [Amycolatopsis rhizosphaerae]TVT43833.1 helix-turn-helix transcriptional regulator [Amycolatopsis rhizosphaerae]